LNQSAMALKIGTPFMSRNDSLISRVSKMTTFKVLAIAFAVLAAAIVAAIYWWKASRISIPNSAASISDAPELHILGTQVAYNESSRLNSRAAIWTGAAAVLSATASVLGVL
jgi:hypothetical protein